MGPSLLLTAPAGSSDTIGDSHRNREDKIHHETSNGNLLPDYTGNIQRDSKAVNSV